MGIRDRGIEGQGVEDQDKGTEDRDKGIQDRIQGFQVVVITQFLGC